MIVQKHQGFTLVELMIVVAIVGILTAIAIPSYQNSLDRSHRAQGQAYLLDLAARQERFYAAFGTYTSVVTGPAACVGAACGLNIVDTSDPDGNVANGWYTVDDGGATTGIALNATSTRFDIALTQRSGWNDTLCGQLTYNSLQQKGETGTGEVADCWR